MNYIKKEFKKLGSMSLIGVGTFLILEHIYSFGAIDFWDILGHEWFGIILIFGGLLWANNWGRLNWKSGLTHALDKLKFIFGKRN